MSEFLKLMGKGKRCWKYVATKEDLLHLKEFEELFERNFHVGNGELLIPKILHFVWLGPKDYPEKSREYLEGWKEKHPDWEVIVWSDRERGLNEKLIGPDLLKGFQPLYDKSDNFGERSDLVRLLVLDEIGGVYIDHDMECRTSFEGLHRSYSFYGGLLTPGNPVIQRSAIMRNSIIGAERGHPILKRALELARERWDHIQEKYPGNDLDSIKRRVTLRVFAAFHDAVLEKIKDPNFKGIVFPAGYFNEIEREFGLFAKEDMVGAWYTEEMNHHEQYLKERIHRMMKRMHLITAILGSGMLVLAGLVVYLWWKIL